MEKKADKYCCHQIQSELLDVMANTITRNIAVKFCEFTILGSSLLCKYINWIKLLSCSYVTVPLNSVSCQAKDLIFCITFIRHCWLAIYMYFLSSECKKAFSYIFGCFRQSNHHLIQHPFIVVVAFMIIKGACITTTIFPITKPIFN